MSARGAGAPGLRSEVDPVLLLCAHGSRSPTAQRATARITEQVGRLLPGTEVVETWVDVQTPDVAQRCAELADRPVVIVPLLLAAGYHVRHDLELAVHGRPHHVVVGALGPDPRLSTLLARRLAEAEQEPVAAEDGHAAAGAGERSEDPIVLIAAGSSDARAVADVRAQAQDLAGRLERPVETGFVSAAQPSAPEAVEAVRKQTGRPVTAASFLLAPGQFHDRAADAGAERISAPLLVEDAVAEEILEIVLQRRQEGLRLLASGGR